MGEHLGTGPDGQNLLGFMCSLGVLTTLARIWPDRGVRMSWRQYGGWRPVWHDLGATTDAELVNALDPALKSRGELPELTQLGSDLPVAPQAFAVFAGAAAQAASPADRLWADFAASLGSEATGDSDAIEDTAFRTMSGAGHQHFLGTIRELVEATDANHIRSALFEAWRYADERPSLRWDPIDDRRYALRAKNPGNSSISPIRTVRGANRLAVEAVVCFPTVPRARGLATTGFIGHEWFTWPIWAAPISLETVRSLLTLPELVQKHPDKKALSVIGVAEVFRCRRFTNGRFRNFTPAAPA